MKKILATLALCALSAAASATTLVWEYDYNIVAAHPGGLDNTQYGYVGLTQDTGFGLVDAGLQVGTADTHGYGTDGQRGWEVGYSYVFPVGKAVFLPRLAYGQMNKINPAGTGFEFNATYGLASAEVQYPLGSTGVGTYFGMSRMKGLNADSIKRATRAQFGFDVPVTKDFTARVGYSFQKFDVYNYGGIVLIGSYNF